MLKNIEPLLRWLRNLIGPRQPEIYVPEYTENDLATLLIELERDINPWTGDYTKNSFSDLGLTEWNNRIRTLALPILGAEFLTLQQERRRIQQALDDRFALIDNITRTHADVLTFQRLIEEWKPKPSPIAYDPTTPPEEQQAWEAALFNMFALQQDKIYFVSVQALIENYDDGNFAICLKLLISIQIRLKQSYRRHQETFVGLEEKAKRRIRLKEEAESRAL